MGILAIQYRTLADAPILIAHNREERYGRPFSGPRIQAGRPRAVCCVDRNSGGTWIGVNQRGVFAAAINAPKRRIPYNPRSRGVLCRELLARDSAEEALEYAERELATGNYAGVNFLCVDLQSGGVAYGGDDIGVEPLQPGLHVLTENRLDDRDDERQEYVRRLLTLHRLDSAVAFLAATSGAFARVPDASGKRGVVVDDGDYGTVCSLLLSLSERSQKSMMQFSNGSPNVTPYDDVSALLRQVLSTDRATQKKGRVKRVSELSLETLESSDSGG